MKEKPPTHEILGGGQTRGDVALVLVEVINELDFDGAKQLASPFLAVGKDRPIKATLPPGEGSCHLGE